jgi:DNA-binding SARP family transcriptional activator
VTRLTIQAFGGLQVFASAPRPLLLTARKAQALLAYLALHPRRPQSRAKLATLLWSDSSDAQARASLRQAVLVLRKSLDLGEDELIAGAGETIELASECADVDVRNFERLLDEGSPAALESAAQLYSGDLLEALETREPAFDDWLAVRRRQLRERAIGAMSHLLTVHAESGQIERAVDVALRLLALDPLQESVHRTLMQLHAKQGRHPSALRQFQLCRDVLARELGTQPHAQTIQLRDAIERQRRATPGAAPPEDEWQDRAELELRHLAIIVAEPAISDGDDPEQAQASSERFATDASALVSRFGGMLERRFGASVTLLFGVPEAHGNDVERAARCALALHELARESRIGFAAGTVLVTRRSGSAGASNTISGEAFGLAARLAAAAAPGEILVSDAAWRSLTNLSHGTACHESALPKTLRATPCWRLVAIRPKPVARGKLVGRGTELLQFATSLEACRRNGTGVTIHVRGEPGIGKSRLVEEFRVIASAQGFACHGGTVLDFGGGAERDALRTLVQGLLDAEGDTDAATQAALSRAVGAGLVDSRHEVHLRDLLHLPLTAAQRVVFDAMDNATREREQNEVLGQLLRRCSEQASRLLVLEDLHWASPRASHRAAALAAAAEHCPAVLVTTARSDGDPLDAAWRSAASISALITFDLGPLRWAEATALAAQFADGNDAFAIRCIERSGGNPLFLEQLLHGGPDDASALPGSVQSVVQARLDRLGTAERHAIRVASVLGQRFPLTALNHLLAGATWEAHLAQGLLRIDGSDGVFAHALVHEGAYASLPRAQRRELHSKAALWFSGRDAVLHAEHLDRADDERAAQAYLDAALLQAAEHRHDVAARLAGRGCELAAQHGPRFGLACARADALYDLGSMAHARDAYNVALALASDDVERCRAWFGLASVLRVLDDLDGAEAALASAEQAATAHGLIEQQARIHFMRGNLLFPKGDLEGCQREHERSLACAREARSVELETAALGGLGDAAFLRGHMLSARERFAGCVALAQKHGLKRVEAANLSMLGIARWFCGDANGALADGLAAVAVAAQIGHRRAETVAHHGCYEFYHGLMQLDGARVHINRALELAREINAARFEAEALAFRGELLRTLGDRHAARAELHQAVAIARTTGLAFMGAIILAMLAVATDDPTARAAALAESEALLGDNDTGFSQLLCRRDTIEANLVAGNFGEALRHAAALEASTRSQPLPWSDFFVARGRALARLGANPADGAAREQLEKLREEGRRLGQLVAVVAIDAALGAARSRAAD